MSLNFIPFLKNVMIIYSSKHIVTLHFFPFHYYQSWLYCNVNLIYLLNKLVDQKYAILRNTADMLSWNDTKVLPKYRESCPSSWRAITLFNLPLGTQFTGKAPVDPDDTVISGQDKTKHLALLNTHTTVPKWSSLSQSPHHQTKT